MPLNDLTALLFVPAQDERRVLSAAKLRPDAVILDLEDGVGADRKDEARSQLQRHMALLSEQGLPVIVRVNPDEEQLAADLQAVGSFAVSAIMLPKVGSPSAIRETNAKLRNRDTAIIALIESPSGLLAAPMIAAEASVGGLALGTEDYAAEMNVSTQSGAMAFAAAHVAVSAVAQAKPCWGITGSIANFTDLELFRAGVTGAKDLGMTGSLAIHPSQLSIIRDVYMPSATEVEHARHIVQSAGQNGGGAFKLDGRMIDEPVVRQATRVLARAVTRRS